MLSNPRIQVSPTVAGRIDRRLLARLATRVRRAAQRLRVDAREFAGLGLRIVDDAEMAELHLEFMGEAGPTDVLSFVPEAPDQELDELGLGDLVLDWDAVERQARDRSPAALLDEATVLLVHGLAHLRGHDHRTRAEGRAMHALERRVLRTLHTPDPPRPYAPWRRPEVRRG
ncbi:MAG TPA: rRNA maturation RNase YbeY [Enhygromyxa sp.]|nr:rRNA maturation RNase YbeY [Enhygromyxa sp.]